MLASKPLLAVLVLTELSVAHAFSMQSKAQPVNVAQRAALSTASMSCIEVYSSPRCPHCVTAKEFLASQGMAFTEVDVTTDDLNMGTMLIRTNGLSSVPQIFIDDQHIGGCSDMLDAARAGSLELSRDAPAPVPDHKYYYKGLIALLERTGKPMPSFSMA